MQPAYWDNGFEPYRKKSAHKSRNKAPPPLEISQYQPGKMLDEKKGQPSPGKSQGQTQASRKSGQKRGDVDDKNENKNKNKNKNKKSKNKSRTRSKSITASDGSSTPGKEEMYLDLKYPKKQTQDNHGHSHSVSLQSGYTKQQTSKNSLSNVFDGEYKNSLQVSESDFIRHASRTSMITLSPKISDFHKQHNPAVGQSKAHDKLAYRADIGIVISEGASNKEEETANRFSLGSSVFRSSKWRVYTRPVVILMIVLVISLAIAFLVLGIKVCLQNYQKHY